MKARGMSKGMCIFTALVSLFAIIVGLYNLGVGRGDEGIVAILLAIAAVLFFTYSSGFFVDLHFWISGVLHDLELELKKRRK